MRNRFKSNTKPFWWVNKNNNYSFTILEVIEEEVEDTIFFIQENKNILPHTLVYHNWYTHIIKYNFNGEKID